MMPTASRDRHALVADLITNNTNTIMEEAAKRRQSPKQPVAPLRRKDANSVANRKEVPLGQCSFFLDPELPAVGGGKPPKVK